MGSSGYAYAPYPWRALIGLRSDGPARFYADLINQALRYGAPVGGRLAPLRRGLGRRPPPTGFLRQALRALPQRRRPDLDRLALDLFAAWPRLTEGLDHAPTDPGDLDILALERSSALTVFVFTGGPDPLLVVKIPSGAPDAILREVAALEAADGAGGAPRFLGVCGGGWVQEAVAGRARLVEPLRSEQCAELPRSEHHARLADAVLAICLRTRTQEAPVERHPDRTRDALEHPSLPEATAAVVRAAFEITEGLGVSVLKHGDLSPQNCLYTEERLAGIVDWESAIPNGTPGFDILNSAIAELDHRLALHRIGPDAHAEGLSAAWRSSPFGEQVRGSVGSVLGALGQADVDVDAVAVSFFARRLGHRMAAPERYSSGVDAALRLLVRVCDQADA